MKIKTNRQTELPRFIVGALATAGASTAGAATVQITFADNVVSSSTGLTRFISDLTGDGTIDLVGELLGGGQVAAIKFLGASDNLAAVATDYPDAYVALGMGANRNTFFGNVSSSGSMTLRGFVAFSFSDLRVEAGALTAGFLDVTLSASAGERKIQVRRLIFDDASTSAPVVALDTTYSAFEPVSAVPEASTSLGLLALGAGGLLTRRRSKRAA